MVRNIRVLFIVLVVLFIAGSTYAFAAANTVPATKLGDGTGTVTGYTITAIAYTLNANPATLDSVAFDVGATAITVKAQLVASGTWYACTNTATTVWSCDTNTLTTASIDQLRVVATSN